LYRQTADIVDSGNQPFVACDMETIGLAVAGVLQHPEETENKYITIYSHKTNQNEVLKALEKKSATKWNVKHDDGKESYATAWRFIQSGINGWPKMLQSYVFRDRDPPISASGTLDGNKLLGIGYKDVETTVDEVYRDMFSD
jgi:hypothetical protein